MHYSLSFGVGRTILGTTIFGSYSGNRTSLFLAFSSCRSLILIQPTDVRSSSRSVLGLGRCCRVSEVMCVLFPLPSGVQRDIWYPFQLFDFQNLKGFSLRFEPAFYINRYFEMNPGGNNSLNFTSGCFILLSRRDRTSVQEIVGYAHSSMSRLEEPVDIDARS